MYRLDTIVFTQVAREFETDQRSHAVPKKREGFIQQWLHQGGSVLYEIRDARKKLFAHAIAAAGKLDRAHFYVRPQSLLPLAEYQGSTPRIRKAEQAKRIVRI